MEVFFMSIRTRCVKANVTTLMTDDGTSAELQQVYMVPLRTLIADHAGVNAFIRVYPEVRHILCRWLLTGT